MLLVDDEPNVLDGLRRHLSSRVDVLTAPSGAAGLALIATTPPAVVVSDMRMPTMDGATFLAAVRDIAPDTVRLLLTGHADIDAAIAAVNEAGIFRFLTKPCPPPTFLAAITAAIAQYRLITAERDLLEHTLTASVEALLDTLALADPGAFAQATAIRSWADAIADDVALPERWTVTVAAGLSQLGLVTLPADVRTKLFSGQPLTPIEREMVGRLPDIVDGVVARIPRLERVRAIILATTGRRVPPELADTTDGAGFGLQASVLRAAIAMERLIRLGQTPADAAAIAAAEPDLAPPVVTALRQRSRQAAPETTTRPVPVRELLRGMQLAEEVRTATGLLLVCAGTILTEQHLERIRNFALTTGVDEPLVITRTRAR